MIYFIIYELIYLSYVWQGVMVLLQVNLINGHWIASTSNTDAFCDTVYDFYSCTTGTEVWLVLAALYDYSHYMDHVQHLFFVMFSCKNAKFRKEVLLILKYLLN